MKPIVFIHANNKQLLGAKVAAYALKARSRTPEAFDVRIIRLEEYPHLFKREGDTYLRKGRDAIWRNNDLQSFSPLRMMVPQIMQFKGRTLLIDPDIFAVGDVNDLLNRDMEGNAIICRHIKDGYKNNGNTFYASSVMLLDCEKLQHWQWDKQIDSMFNKRLDYGDWISLKLEDPHTIGKLEEEWNHFDVLNDKTKLLHNTERSTQPWKTGLPVDYDTTITSKKSCFFSFKKSIKSFFIKSNHPTQYLPHPDPAQETYFLNLLKECLIKNEISRDFLDQEIVVSNVRSDIYKQLERI